MLHDIVYILKNDIDDDELVYSIRSVEANFPFNKIWFAGGVPEHVKPDNFMSIRQEGKNKWEKVTNTLKQVCKNDDITEDFWLFNDDFFVMSKMGIIMPYIRGSMHQRVYDLKRKYKNSSYSGKLEKTENYLRSKGYDTLDYALHMPMLINRQKALETISEFPDSPMFRCLYGNHHKIGGIVVKDVKIKSLDIEPTGDELYLSTTEESFKKGIVGEYIRDKFPYPSRYEV